jgi:cyclopropane fatty-acyl-phospholipid synthase-like methyltransferase
MRTNRDAGVAVHLVQRGDAEASAGMEQWGVSMADHDDARSFWDGRFDTEEYIFGLEPNVFLAREAHRIPAGSEVLDVACGEGRNAVWLARQGHRVSGLDISPFALAKAARLAEAHGVSPLLRQCDLRDWTWEPAAYDAIVCIFIQFAAPAERQRLFEGFLTALRPGGLVLLHGYTPRQLEYRTGGPGDIAHLYTADLLREGFAGFDLLLLEEYEAELAEGSKHVGRSALIDLVARKRG